MSGSTLPAPVGGLNTISALTDMPITDAIVLENLVPNATDVQSRDGFARHVTPALTGAQTLVSYNAATPTLLLGANGNIYDVTTAGAGSDLTGALSPLTNNKWHTNGFKDKLIFCNSADVPMEYDGTSVTLLALTTADASATNLVTNGTFDSDTAWTKGTGWTIAAGVAASDGTQVADADLTQSITPTEFKVYKIVYTVSGYTAGNVTAVVGETEGTDRASDGTFTEYLAAGSGTDIDIRADLDFVGNIDAVEVYATELTLTDLAGSMTFKGRVIYWEKPTGSNPQSYWYAGAGAYTGALTEFPLVEFVKGGYVVQCFTWTRDGGAGPDDYFCVLMSTGEVMVYSGDDSGGANWALVGIYTIGEPVSGNHPVIPIGGDNIILTKDGYLVLSAAIQDGRYSENSHYSFKISPTASGAAQSHGDNFGWEATLYTGGSLFIVNVPISASESQQHVRNTTTGAWTTFSGLNATAFAAHDGGLYFADTDGFVNRYIGTSDNGGFIPMRGTQAYSYLGSPNIRKQVSAIEVQSNYQYPAYLWSTFWGDYNTKDLTAIVDPPEPTSSDWDVADWDVADWGTAVLGTKTGRKNATGYGYSLSHTLRLKSRAQRFIWYASHIYVKQAGVV